MGVLGKLLGRRGRDDPNAVPPGQLMADHPGPDEPRFAPKLQDFMLYVMDLPPGWLPGLASSADPLAQAELEETDLVGVAQVAGYRGRYIPTLCLSAWGPAQVADADALLDTQAQVFDSDNRTRTATRVELPVGPALRHASIVENPHAGPLALVAYYIVTPIGGYCLRLWCEQPDLPRYEAAVDAAAESFHIPEPLLAADTAKADRDA